MLLTSSSKATKEKLLMMVSEDLKMAAKIPPCRMAEVPYSLLSAMAMIFSFFFSSCSIISLIMNPLTLLYWYLYDVDFELDKTFDFGFGGHIVFQIERLEIGHILKLLRLEFTISDRYHVLGGKRLALEQGIGIFA